MTVEAVRRPEDKELCGFVDQHEGGWCARTVFGAMLGHHETEGDARRQVLAEGLASLTDRWTLLNGATGETEVACILEANPSSVTVVRDYLPLPGAPTLTISAAQFAAGEWELHR